MRKRVWNRKVPAWRKRPATAKEKAEKKEKRLLLQSLAKRRRSMEEKVCPVPLIRISHRQL